MIDSFPLMAAASCHVVKFMMHSQAVDELRRLKPAQPPDVIPLAHLFGIRVIADDRVLPIGTVDCYDRDDNLVKRIPPKERT